MALRTNFQVLVFEMTMMNDVKQQSSENIYSLWKSKKQFLGLFPVIKQSLNLHFTQWTVVIFWHNLQRPASLMDRKWPTLSYLIESTGLRLPGRSIEYASTFSRSAGRFAPVYESKIETERNNQNAVCNFTLPI